MVLETYRASFRLQHSHLLQLFPPYDASTPNHLPFVFYLPMTVRLVQGSTKANSITVQTCRQATITSLEELDPFSAKNHCTVA